MRISLLESGNSPQSSCRPVDTLQFNDPVASQIGWIPKRQGGANYCTRKLVEVSPERLEFQVSNIAAYVYMIPLLFGVCLLGWVAYAMFCEGATLLGSDADNDLRIRTGIGLLCLVCGATTWHSALCPIVFDARLGMYWKGRREPAPLLDRVAPEDAVPFDRIYAFQILAKYCHDEDEDSFYSYELNLVLGDRSRVNVIDHGDLGRIRADARTIGNLLGRPVWDGVV